MIEIPTTRPECGTKDTTFVARTIELHECEISFFADGTPELGEDTYDPDDLLIALRWQCCFSQLEPGLEAAIAKAMGMKLYTVKVEERGT